MGLGDGDGDGLGLGDGDGLGVGLGLGLGEGDGLGDGDGVGDAVGFGVALGVAVGNGVGNRMVSSIRHESLYNNTDTALSGISTFTPGDVIKSLYVTPVAGNVVLTLVAIFDGPTKS